MWNQPGCFGAVARAQVNQAGALNARPFDGADSVRLAGVKDIGLGTGRVVLIQPADGFKQY